ncbi:hypothetical protein OSTOST_17062, partial [Ostertagia ostertagi]
MLISCCEMRNVHYQSRVRRRAVELLSVLLAGLLVNGQNVLHRVVLESRNELWYVKDEMPRGRRERRPEKECGSAGKPPAVQMCSLGNCGKPQLLTNRVFEQNASEKKLTLGIGGVATLYQGTSIKIKCPRKNFDKKKIYWTKNGKRIRNDGIKVSVRMGNLLSVNVDEDAGVYECYTDSLQGNVTLRFKYRDDDKPNRLRPSQLHKGHKGKNKNASLFE